MLLGVNGPAYTFSCTPPSVGVLCEPRSEKDTRDWVPAELAEGPSGALYYFESFTIVSSWEQTTAKRPPSSPPGFRGEEARNRRANFRVIADGVGLAPFRPLNFGSRPAVPAVRGESRGFAASREGTPFKEDNRGTQ